MGGVEPAVVAVPLPTSSDVLPDLSDDLTRLGLLALVRERHGDPTLTHYWDPDITSQGSWCMPDGDGGLWLGDTEAAVFVAALEAAP
jgi:hypothetical protein